MIATRLVCVVATLVSLKSGHLHIGRLHQLHDDERILKVHVSLEVVERTQAKTP